MRGGIKADIIGLIIWIGSSFYWLFVTTLKNLTSSHSHTSSSSSNTDDEKDNAKDAVSCDICFPKCFVVKCRRKSVIYVATVTNQITEQQMCFAGRTSQEFGTYYRETIRYSLENPKFKSMSSLGKYVWKLENENAQFKIRWFLFPQTDRNMNILEPLIRQYKGSVSNLRSHLTSEHVQHLIKYLDIITSTEDNLKIEQPEYIIGQQNTLLSYAQVIEDCF